MPEGLKAPKVLTDADFVESMGYLEPHPVEPDTCLLIIAHTNLYGTKPVEDEHDGCGARDFLEMVLTVAQEFPEVRVGLLNDNDAPDAFIRLSIDRRPPYAEALVCVGLSDWRRVECIDNDTLDSLRLWLRGILLTTGFRPTNSRDDLTVRLAYELAQPERYSFDDARWDVPHFRYRLYEAAKHELDRLTEEWVHKSP